MQVRNHRLFVIVTRDDPGLWTQAVKALLAEIFNYQLEGGHSTGINVLSGDTSVRTPGHLVKTSGQALRPPDHSVMTPGQAVLATW